jgi:glutamate carboxypeptidase
MRPLTAADQQRAQAALEEAVAAVAAAHDVRMNMHGGFARPPKPIDAAAEKLFQLVRQCGAISARK